VGSACDERLGVNTAAMLVETDNNPPTIDVRLDPPLNAAGWSNTAVTVVADCADVEGPIASCPSPVTVDTEGYEQTISLRAVDAVANETVADAIVSIDTTVPTVDIIGINPDAVVVAGSDAAATCIATDALSGLNGTCTLTIEEITTTPSRARFRATATATDLADNTTVATLEYDVVYDIAAPDVTVTADTQPNESGWFNTPVTYSFTCADVSGVAVCPAPVTTSTDGADQTVTVAARDVVGNTADTVVSGINIDRTPPVIVAAAPATVKPADTVTISCQATDRLSGIATTTCAPDQIDASTLTPGVNTFSFTATDIAGNTTTTTITVTLRVDVDGIVALIARYLGDTPGANGQLNAMRKQLANRDITGFTNHVWAQCCTPAKNKRFTNTQATTLVTLAATLR
jgi:hypothetical protein